MKRNILIIGGMGPQASIKLHENIIGEAIKNGARNPEDFPAITHLSLPFKDFIANDTHKRAALDLIKERLYYLWRYRVFTYNHRLQYCTLTYR